MSRIHDHFATTTRRGARWPQQEAGCRLVVGYNSRATGAAALAANLTGTAIAPPARQWRTPPGCAMEREYGCCDVQVKAAGLTRMIPHADLDALPDELIDAISVDNVRGPFVTIRAGARPPHLRSPRGGHRLRARSHHREWWSAPAQRTPLKRVV